MTVSAVPSVIDWCVAQLTTAFPSTALVAGQPVQVFDGVGDTSEDTGRQAWVGISDPNDDGAVESATADQIFPYATTHFVRESLTVHLVAQAWTGDSDPGAVKTMRDAAYSIAGVIMTAVVGDASLGGIALTVPGVMRSQTFRQVQDASGTLAVLAFDIEALAQFQN